MPNVRIKKAPRTGEQEDYALVYNDVAISESKPKEGVKNTMTAVPRKEASIEVEGGESVIGDINQDGFLELMSFQGKRHSEGGMPVNIPDGSFIFSDTSKLKIKDPELLKYFGMGNNKKGYTPAQISKKYQINEYIDTLKNEDADDIAKKTANEMLKNNTKKLAELAVVQESMKGFENGIPDFAASVMAGLQGEQPQMKEGGWLPKYQNAGEKSIWNISGLVTNSVNPNDDKEEDQKVVTSITKPRQGEIYYFNGEKYQIDVNSKLGDYSKGYYVFKPLNKESNLKPIQLKDAEFKKYTNAEEPYKQYLGTNPSNAKINNYYISTKPGKVYEAPTTIKFGEVELPTKNNIVPSTITDFTKIVSDKEGKLYYLANADIKEKPYMHQYPFETRRGYSESPESAQKLKWTSPIVETKALEVSPIFDDNDNVIGYKPIGKQTKIFTEKDLSNLEFLQTSTNNNQQEFQEPAKINDLNISPENTGNTGNVNNNTINPQTSTGTSRATINPTRVYKEGGLVKFQEGSVILEDYYKDIVADDKGVKRRKDEEGREHIYDSEGYAGYIQGNVFYQWQPTTEYYIGVTRDGSNKFVDYAPPIVTKEMQEKVKQSDIYKKNIEEFNKMVDTDEEFRKGVIKEYRILYPDDKISEDQIINNLKKQQQIGVTHDLMYDAYYPNFKSNLENDPNDIWDAPKDPITGAPRADLMNSMYSKSASQFGIDYSGGTGVGEYSGRKEINNIQKSYIASQKYLHGEGKDKYKNYGFAPSPTGKNDEKSGYARTSQADDWAGDTYSWQYNKYIAPETPVVDEKPKEPPVADKRDLFTVDEVKPGEDYEKEKPLLDTWFAPDITNFVGAITDPINRYEPVQGKVNLVTPGYDLLDPTRQLAANQEQMARYQYMLENSVDPQIALSASLAASGEGFQNAANVLANVENANVGIVNQAYQQNAAIKNNEIMANENARQKYIAEMATLNENMDKAKSLKKWRVISAYNQGWHNFNKDQMMEQVLFPQVHTDNITGAVQFSGNGRMIDEYDTYGNVLGSKQAMSQEDYYKWFSSIPGETSADKLNYIKGYAMISNPKLAMTNNANFQQDYAEAQGLLSQQFGGAFNINDYIGI